MKRIAWKKEEKTGKERLEEKKNKTQERGKEGG